MPSSGVGGLGIKNLKLQALVLRVRWEWLRRTEPDRPWQGLSMMVDDDARAVFDSFIRISAGDGRTVLFWRDRWILGFTIHDIAPTILELVPVSNQNRRTVHSSLMDNGWATDVHGEISFVAHLQLTHLLHAISMVPRDEGVPNHFSWPRAASGTYSAGSVYKRLCRRLVRFPYARCI